MLKRGQKDVKIYQIQRRLQSLGLMKESVIITGKGIFGPSTQKSMVAYFEDLKAQVENGSFEIEHWKSLFPFFKSLPNFNGDADWIHAREGHNGKPYWARGKSGITLDAGVDLGYVDADLFKEAFKFVLSEHELKVCLKVIERRLRGSEALLELDANKTLKSIRISRTEAENVFPVVASKYWRDITNRFPTLLNPECLPAVQTALLSLAYNRGSFNRGLEVLAKPLENKDWLLTAKLIGAMQQDHDLKGIRKRRKLESELIHKELNQ